MEVFLGAERRAPPLERATCARRRARALAHFEGLWRRAPAPAITTDSPLEPQLVYFAKPELLVIDELGYLPFEKRGAHLFFQLVAGRYERGSLLITTNQVVTQWGAVFGDDALAAAILDRLLHHSHTLMIQERATD